MINYPRGKTANMKRRKPAGNETQKIARLRTAVEQGNAEAQCDLGILYYGGKGVSKDLALARQLFEAAAVQGLAIASFNLGRIYHFGQGTGIDFKRAMKHYRRAARQGHEGAKAQLRELKRPVKSLSPRGWAIVLAALIFPIAAAATYSAPYRWLVWLQLQLFDAFIPTWTVLVLLMATLSLAGVLVNKLPGTQCMRPGYNPDWYHRLTFRLRNRPRFVDYAVICLLILYVFVIGPLLQPMKLWDGLTAGPLVQSELTQIVLGKAPQSRYVDLAGIPRFDLGSSYGIETLRSPVLVRSLFPLVEPGWKSGKTIFVFVDTYENNLHQILTAYRPSNDYEALVGINSRERHEHDANGVAMVRVKGLLRENGLSSLAEKQLREAGLRIAQPYYVLDHTLSPENAWYLTRMIVLVLIFGLVMSAFFAAAVRL